MSIQETTAVSTQEFESIRQFFLEVGQQVKPTLLLLSSVVSVFTK